MEYCPTRETCTRWIERSGDVLQIALPAGVFIQAAYRRDLAGIGRHTVALLCNQAALFVIRRVTRVQRPRGTALNSFPSGHTAAVFTATAFYSARYPNPALNALCVLLSLFVGFSRWLAERHWPSDVLGGIILGSTCGLFFAFVRL